MLRKRSLQPAIKSRSQGRLPPLGQISPRQAPTIDSLPDPLLELILAMAVNSQPSSDHTRTIIRLSLVCRRWKVIAAASSDIWRAFVVFRFPKATSSKPGSAGTVIDWHKIAFTAAMAERRKRLAPEVRRALQSQAASAPDYQRALRALAIDLTKAVYVNGSSLQYRAHPQSDVHIHDQLLCVCAQQCSATPTRLFDLRSIAVMARSRTLESGISYPMFSIDVGSSIAPALTTDALKLVELPDDRRNALAILGVFSTGEIAFVFASFPARNAVAAVWNKDSGQQTLPQQQDHTPVYDDLDSRYGFHDYTIDVALRSFDAGVLWQQTFRNIDGDITDAASGHHHSAMLLSLISRDGRGVREVLPCRPQLSWRTAAFSSVVDNVLIADIKIVDSNGDTVWSFSRLASFTKDIPGGFFSEPKGSGLSWLHEHQGRGSVGMSLVEFNSSSRDDDYHTNEFAIVELWVALDVNFLISWFGKLGNPHH